MEILYTKAFIRQYKHLPSSLKQKTKKAIEYFVKNPKDERLKTHKLEGKLGSMYSFSVDFEYRIVFEFHKSEAVFLKVGNHSVYR